MITAFSLLLRSSWRAGSKAATLSTGPLVKVEDTLVVTVSPLAAMDMTSPAKTNLGIFAFPERLPFPLPPPPQPPPSMKEQEEK
ncbi:unnamed protein product [Arctogadus glacialis]